MKQVRKAIKAQLQYICSDVGYIVQFVQNGILLTDAQTQLMNLLTALSKGES